MKTRRDFLIETGAIAIGSLILPSSFSTIPEKARNIGVQLYTFRREMSANPAGTLKQIASLGIKQIESASSEKGNYYGLKPKEIKKICSDLGMTLRSGHVQINEKWQQSLEEATEAGQEYVICSSMPARGDTVDNYKKAAEFFNKSGEDCKKLRLRLGYHNHDYEFKEENGQTLYDVLLKNTEPGLVQMEMDLGWVIAAGKNPLDYFKSYPGRFPLWHLKDMDLDRKRSTEFGKGSLQIGQIMKRRAQAGMKYFFVEQEEYESSPFESMKENMDYLGALNF